ncbi:MAG: hypothetical protein WB762_06790 [Candidatus Sulfotelmatobacter sp.]
MMPSPARLLTATLLIAVVLDSCGSAAAQAAAPVHGLWAWKGPSIVATTGGIEHLRDFCSSEGVNEIYISVSSHGKLLEGDFPKLIDVLHRSGVRVLKHNPNPAFRAGNARAHNAIGHART